MTISHTRRLLVDTVRRTWMSYAMAGALLLVQAWMVSLAESGGGVRRSPPNLLAWSLTACWFLAFFPAMALDLTELSVLPVSRRQMWVVRWQLAVLAPAVLLPLVFGAASLTVMRHLDLQALFTRMLYCALYGGVFMALAAIFPLVPATEPGAIGRVLIRFICIPFGGAILPFWLAKYLPRTFADMNGPMLGVLVAAAGVAIASYFYRPEIDARPSPPRLRSHRNPDQGLPRSFRVLDYLPGNILTGLPRLFYVHAREIAIVAPFAFLMIWVLDVATESGSSNSMRHMFHRMQVMPFDVNYVFDGPRGFNVLIWVFLGMGFRLRELTQRMRALRVLPMTTGALALTFSGLSIATAAMIWIWLIALHTTVVGSLPPTLRLDIFVIFCGAMILTRAVELAIPSRFAGQFLGMLTFMPLVFAATVVFPTPTLAMIVTGIICGVGGTALQYWLLRRRHQIYQFKPPTFLGRPMPS